MSDFSAAGVMTRLCRDLVAQVPALGPICERIQARADAPLRVAIVGRVNAGKSTLLNALLGRRIVPTPVSEWTSVTTWLHFGSTDAAVVIPKDGTPRPVAFTPDGCLPVDLSQTGLPVSGIQRIEVTLDNEGLCDLVLIDTPGLAAINESASALTLDVLNGTDEAADAVVFVFSQTLTGGDRAVIDDFAQKAGGPWNSPVRMIAVLTKADLLADEGGGLGPAQRVARRFETNLRHRVVSVVPVVGLLAETVRCQLLTDAMAQEISDVAKASDRWVQLASPAHFAGDSRLRKDLLDRLSTFGVAAGVAFVDGGGDGAEGMAAHLGELSGIEQLERLLSRRFREAATVLQVQQGLRELEAVAADGKLSPVELQVVRDLVDRARLDPEMHRLVELEAEEALLRGEVSFRADKLQAALRILGPGRPEERLGSSETDPKQLADIARTAVEDWHETAVVSVDPDRARIASCVSRSAHLMYLALSAQP